MNLRDRVKKAFHRPSKSKISTNANGKDSGIPIRIEYYKRHEVPPSKFKGPFDPEHQRRLAAWSFDSAMAPRSRSIDLSLSPCATLPESICPLDPGPFASSTTTTIATMPAVPCYDDLDEIDPCHVSISIFHDDNDAYAPDDDSGSQSSSSSSSATTAIDSSDSSFTGSSASTLQVDRFVFREDSITQLKEAVRYTSPILRTKSPPPVGTPKGKRTKMPFAPEDLARALNAVQLVCT